MSMSYQEDLAYIHHTGFSDFITQATPGLLAELDRAGIHGGLVVDLGCGSGTWARALLQAGYAVLGVDQSEAMVALARTVAPGATFVQASLHEFAIPPCQVVTALGEAISYLPDATQRISLAPLFSRVAGALPRGGLFILDLIRRDRRRPLHYRSWQAGPDWAVLVEVQEDLVQGLVRRDITTFRQVGEEYRRGQETHWAQLFTRAEVEEALRQAGFAVKVGRKYGDYTLAPRRLAFLARR